MMQISLPLLPPGNLMTGTFAPPSLMPLLCWMWTAKPTSKVLTMNGWQVKFHPFGRIAQILLWTLSPFMVFLDKIALHITLLTILPFDTTLMTSRVQIPLERTHGESCVFDVGILDTVLVHASHPP